MSKTKKSPLQRSMSWWREAGYLVAKTETWNPHAHKRQDLFGFADMLAIGHDQIIAVQVCGAGTIPAHQEKMADNRADWLWMDCGGDVCCD